MSTTHGMDNTLYFDCLQWGLDVCVDPNQPHVVLNRDYEHAIYATALLQDHGEAVIAAEKIRQYLEEWADEEIYVIQLLRPDENLKGFLADMDLTIKENEEDKIADVRAT